MKRISMAIDQKNHGPNGSVVFIKRYNFNSLSLTALILRITKTEDHLEDRIQENQAKEETEALTKSFREFVLTDKSNHSTNQAQDAAKSPYESCYGLTISIHSGPGTI